MKNIKRLAVLYPQNKFKQSKTENNENQDKSMVFLENLSKSLIKYDLKIDLITRDHSFQSGAAPKRFVSNYPDSLGLRQIKLPFAGDNLLTEKNLWPHLKEYAAAIAEFYDEEGKFPDLFLTYSAAAGLAGVLLREKLAISFCFLALTPADNKLAELELNNKNCQQISQNSKLAKKIIAKRLALNYSSQVISLNKEQLNSYQHECYQDVIKNNKLFNLQLTPPEITSGNLTDSKAKLLITALTDGLNHPLNPTVNLSIPDYYLLPDSDNEHQLKETFRTLLLKK